MALPALSPEQRQAALEKAREVRAARSAVLASLKEGTITLADVLGREDDTARRTKVSQVIRALPGIGQARAAAIMERAGITPDRRVGGLGARQREQLLAQFPGSEPCFPVVSRPAPDAHWVMAAGAGLAGTCPLSRGMPSRTTGTLPARLMILSNELPRFGDASGAIADRFVILRLTQSWLRREDSELTAALLTELPGILNWSLDGLTRLDRNGLSGEINPPAWLTRAPPVPPGPLAACTNGLMHAGRRSRQPRP